MSISCVGSFPMQSGGSLIIFQIFRCRNLVSNSMFSYTRVRHGGAVSLGGICMPPYICMLPYIHTLPYTCTPPLHLYAPIHLYVLPLSYVPHMLWGLGGISIPHMSWVLLVSINTSVRHFGFHWNIHLPLSS